MPQRLTIIQDFKETIPIMIDDMLSAFGFLTVLPLTNIAGGSTPRPGRMYAYFPLVGLLIGAFVALVAFIPFFPRPVVAFLVLAVWVILSGGLHLDGLADTCDGLLSATTPERRREIMKDPRAGAWAIVGVSLLLLGKWIMLTNVSALVLLLPPVAGRWAMVMAAAVFPRASDTGMASRFANGFGQNQLIAASITALVVLIAVSLVAGWRVLLAGALTPLLVFGLGTWAVRRLGGLTGDIYGAICELVELVCLIALTIR
jgi:adenosylcobinamide-GDP ribazoletransferase